MAKATATKKKKSIKLPVGVLHIHTSFNNTIVTLTDPQGNKVSGGGTGLKQFKGAKQSTPYAAEVLTRDLIKEAKESFGLKELSIMAKGLGMGRDGVFKGINDTGGIEITSITEATGIQFGGNKGARQKRN